MNRIVCRDYDEISRLGALMFARQIWQKPDSVLGFATGGTPEGLYRNLRDMCAHGMLDFSSVVTFNLDEYYPIDKNNDQSYDYFMWKNLFFHINIRRENVHLPDGAAQDPLAACAAYEAQIEAAGGIDMQLLGIGNNGHIAFNEPAQALNLKTGVVELTPNTIEANARFFASADEVPRRALSMGIGTILAAKRIVMLINGGNKAAAVRDMFGGTITTQIPATLLQLHPDVTVILDEEAASLLA